MAFNQRRPVDTWNFNPYVSEDKQADIADLIARLAQERAQYQSQFATGDNIQSEPIGDIHSAARFGTAQTGSMDDYIPPQYPSNTAATIMAQQYGKAPHGFEPTPTPSDRGDGGSNTKKRIDATLASAAASAPEIRGDDALFRRLVNSATNVPMINYDDLIAQNTAAIQKAYAPQISGLRTANKLTKGEFKRNRRIINHMANQAMRHFEGQSQRAQEGTVQARKNINAETAKEEGGVDARTVKSETDLAKMLADVGAPVQDFGAMAMHNADLGAKEKQDIRSEGRTQKKINAIQGNRQVNYLANMAAGARLSGNDAIADLIDQKVQILNANRTQIGTLKGERGKEISNMATGLNVQEAQDQVAAEAATWDRLMGLAGLKEQKYEFDTGQSNDFQQALLAAQARVLDDQSGSSAKTIYDYLDKSGYGAAIQGAQLQFNPTQSGQFQSILDWYTGSPKFKNDQLMPANSDTPVDLTPQRIGQIMADRLRKAYGWNEQQIAQARPLFQVFARGLS